MDAQGVGTLLIGIVSVVNVGLALWAKYEAARAVRHSTNAVAAISEAVGTLETNTNSKMDALLASTERAAGLAGEKRGVADEQARRSKEQT